MKRRSRSKARMREREAGFDLVSTATAKLPEYNGLFDSNLRHYFENRRIQHHLKRTGLIDHDGHVIDLAKNAGKLQIIEQEFRHAELEELARKREEDDMRRRVQLKRHEALERAKLRERMAKVREDRMIRKEIVRVAKGDLTGGSTLRRTGSGRGRGGGGGSGRADGAGTASSHSLRR